MPERIIFTEEFCQPEDLYPFTLTRQIQDIRIGILTIREKWERLLGAVSYDKFEDDYKDLDRAVRIDKDLGAGVIYMVHGNLLPTPELVNAIKKLKNGEFLSLNGDAGIVFRFSVKEIVKPNQVKMKKAVVIRNEVPTIRFPWDITRLNATALMEDWKLLKGRRKSQPLSRTNKVTKAQNVFVEKGARVEHAVINATDGPVYIGKNALVMEGSLIRGPVSIGEGSVVKMGTRIYGATTIGPGCVAGGEIKNSVIFGHSNKAHDGYLGDSVLGEWCNWGAGTSNSNIKNNAGTVRVWTRKGEIEAGNKCGVFMGDYSRTAINTSINTGTVIGVSCNVFGNGLTPKYIPSFAWGSDGLNRYRLEKALDDIRAWKKMKGQLLSMTEESILHTIYHKY